MRSAITRMSVRVNAESKQQPVAGLRKKLEEKRKVSLKENLNKLSIVATEDFKFVSETVQELDKIHKEWFDKNFQKKGSRVNDGYDRDDEDSGGDSGNGQDNTLFLKD